MLRLRSHLLSAVRATSPLPAAASSLHRLLLYSTAAATTTPAAHFGVEEDNLTNSCGLTPAQASSDLPDLKSPSNPDATVRAYLAGIGITQKDVAAAVSMDPRFLCSSVDETLAPRIAELRRAGLSTPEISRLISVVPNDGFIEPDWIPRLAYCRSFEVRYILASIIDISPGDFSARMDFLKEALGCSKGELRLAVQVGLEPGYIARNSGMLNSRMTEYLKPRHYVLKTLKANGLVKDVDFFTAVRRTEKVFVKMFVDPYKKRVPGIADAYAAACAGQDDHIIQPYHDTC
ncbi:hypothetical protein HU200_058185 [Digitaria exilis]|uniref:Uncharacterized protein n=1 Tax=Digitaria exilis TaxID=1010633 RepID=A0A835AN57_9POAL|nr:hypothetical protein HU200_058185 [Digitaria exilis]